MHRTLIPADPELWRRTGQAVALRCPNASTEPCAFPACMCHQPQDQSQRFREHEGDDYPVTDEDGAFRARWWRIGIALTLAVWGAVAMVFLPGAPQ